ncbi:hypothetical protein HK405_004430 [Cladochytrium tenue]|nr:hypothetical protein HK405_004430 [Cladochytrium tenue]
MVEGGGERPQAAATARRPGTGGTKQQSARRQQQQQQQQHSNNNHTHQARRQQHPHSQQSGIGIPSPGAARALPPPKATRLADGPARLLVLDSVASPGPAVASAAVPSSPGGPSIEDYVAWVTASLREFHEVEVIG